VVTASRHPLWPACAAALLGGACKPTLDQTVSIVSEPTVLAVRSDPPEAVPIPPANGVKLTALYVDGSGAIADASIDWAFCTARNPLANLGRVNPECVRSSGSWFVPVGVGLDVSGTLPNNGCIQFGPEVPQPMMGQPPGRPVDPDLTGGYYQPVRVLATNDGGTSVTVGETRLSCGLAGGVGNVSADYEKRYHFNVNPKVGSLSLAPSASPGAVLSPDDQGAKNAVQAGEHVTLRASWAVCPTTDACGDGFCGPDDTVQTCPSDCATPTGCAGAERYAGFDLSTQTIVDRREAIAVAWFATGGAFDYDRTGRVSTDLATTSDNGWQAPLQAGLVHLWVIVRDDRGGTGWAEYAFDVH
jgi:hypothetical protein